MPSESPISVVAEGVQENSMDSSVPPVDGPGSTQSLRARVLSGSMIMLVSSGFVGAANLVYNLAIAHTLGADNFGQASAVYTVLMLLSAVTLSFQFAVLEVCRQERFARGESRNLSLFSSPLVDYSALGISLVPGLCQSGSHAIPESVHTQFTSCYWQWPLDFIFLSGFRRGLMQGMYDFQRLAP